jgi:RNA recognition motif-containing protein
MGTRLYVGNLGYTVTDADLRQLFAPHGTVESVELITEGAGRSNQGFGFVEMGSSDEARAAVGALNGFQHNGRALSVNVAKPKENRGRGGSGREGSGSRRH